MKTLARVALALAVAPALGAAEKHTLPKELPPFGEDKPLPPPVRPQLLRTQGGGGKP